MAHSTAWKAQGSDTTDAIGSTARRKMHLRLLYALLLILSTYAVFDIAINHSGAGAGIALPCTPQRERKIFFADQAEPEEWRGQADMCGRREGFLEKDDDGGLRFQRKAEENPWNEMKWIGEAAACRVKGHLIEKLDERNNFRRGFALRFADDVEDKIHILPWLLASRVDLNQRKRRVLLDLGANAFSTSLLWFLRMYPCDFTHIHAFEVDPNLLHKPSRGFNESANAAGANPSSINVKATPEPPQWMLDRIRVHYNLVSDGDDAAANAINITRFIKQELGLTPADTVVVKMDIEGSEWPILRRWMTDPDMPLIVDELFVEVHYNHPSMWNYHWARFGSITRDNATRLLADLRWHGFFAHFWP